MINIFQLERNRHFGSYLGNFFTDKLKWPTFVFVISLYLFTFCSITLLPLLNFLQLFDLVYREETLLNVIKSVTRNGRSIILTAVLALILVYLFSIIGFLFLKDDFTTEVDRLKNRTPMTGMAATAEWALWQIKLVQSLFRRLYTHTSGGFFSAIPFIICSCVLLRLKTEVLASCILAIHVCRKM